MILYTHILFITKAYIPSPTIHIFTYTLYVLCKSNEYINNMHFFLMFVVFFIVILILPTLLDLSLLPTLYQKWLYYCRAPPLPLDQFYKKTLLTERHWSILLLPQWYLLSHVNLTTNRLRTIINIILIMTQQATYAYEYDNIYVVVAYLRRANKNYVLIVLRTPALSEQRFE